jgi:hypothetical protein
MMMMSPHGMGNSHPGPHIPLGSNQMGFSPPSVGMMPLPPGNFLPPTHPGVLGGPPKDGMQQGWMPGPRGTPQSVRRNAPPTASASGRPLRVDAPAFVPGAPAPRGNWMMQQSRSRENLDLAAQPPKDVPLGGSSDSRSPMKVAAPHQVHSLMLGWWCTIANGSTSLQTVCLPRL